MWKSVGTLVNRFTNQPYYSYTESDSHCYLYYLLYKGSTMKKGFKTEDIIEHHHCDLSEDM